MSAVLTALMSLMEVAGTKPKEEDSDISTDKNLKKKNLFCQPCQTDWEDVAAVGYCRDCNEFICQPCAKAHRRNKATKFHEIMEGDNMPEEPLIVDDLKDEDSYETCKIHSVPGLPALIKFYCAEHDRVACGDCIVVNHNSCKAQYIKHVTKEFNADQELATVQQTLAEVESKVDACNKTIIHVHEMNVNTDLKVLEDVREFKTEVTTYVGKKEEELLVKINAAKELDQLGKQEKLAKCSKAKSNLCDIREELEPATWPKSKGFAILKRSGAVLEDIEQQMEDTENDTVLKRREYIFQRDCAIVKILTSQKHLGSLVTEADIAKAKNEADIAKAEHGAKLAQAKRQEELTEAYYRADIARAKRERDDFKLHYENAKLKTEKVRAMLAKEKDSKAWYVHYYNNHAR